MLLSLKYFRKKNEWVTAKVLVHPQCMYDGGVPSEGRGKKEVVCHLSFVKEDFSKS